MSVRVPDGFEGETGLCSLNEIHFGLYELQEG